MSGSQFFERLRAADVVLRRPDHLRRGSALRGQPDHHHVPGLREDQGVRRLAALGDVRPPSPTKVDRKLIQIAAEPEDGGLRGPLEIKVVLRAKPVIIDGLVLSVW